MPLVGVDYSANHFTFLENVRMFVLNDLVNRQQRVVVSIYSLQYTQFTIGAAGLVQTAELTKLVPLEMCVSSF